MMSLQILHTESSCGWGGQELRILSESEGLVARGYKVTIACPREAPLWTESSKRGLPTVALPIEKKRFRGFGSLRQLLQTQHFDVINSHSSTDSWLSALACASLSRAPALVRTRHVSAPLDKNFGTRWVYRQPQRVVTTGEIIRQALIDDLGLLPGDVVSIPTGIDPNRFVPAADKEAIRSSLGLKTAGRWVGIVATLRSWKGHRFLIDALTDPSLGQFHLLIVGDGPQRSNLSEQVRQRGLENRVHFAGHQSNPVPWLQAMDYFCLPSTANEGVPQSLIQAMMSGLPCVTTPAGAIAELARDGVNALVVEKENVVAIRQALLRLSVDTGLAQCIGEKARACAVQEHSLERMLDQMEVVFQSAVNDRPGGL